MTGSLSLTLTLHHTKFNVLTLFINMTRRVDPVEKEVLQYQLAMKGYGFYQPRSEDNFEQAMWDPQPLHGSLKKLKPNLRE